MIFLFSLRSRNSILISINIFFKPPQWKNVFKLFLCYNELSKLHILFSKKRPSLAEYYFASNEHNSLNSITGVKQREARVKWELMAARELIVILTSIDFYPFYAASHRAALLVSFTSFVEIFLLEGPDLGHLILL